MGGSKSMFTMIDSSHISGSRKWPVVQTSFNIICVLPFAITPLRSTKLPPIKRDDRLSNCRPSEIAITCEQNSRSVPIKPYTSSASSNTFNTMASLERSGWIARRRRRICLTRNRFRNPNANRSKFRDGPCSETCRF